MAKHLSRCSAGHNPPPVWLHLLATRRGFHKARCAWREIGGTDKAELVEEKVDDNFLGKIELVKHVDNTGGQDLGYGGFNKGDSAVWIVEGSDVLVDDTGLRVDTPSVGGIAKGDEKGNPMLVDVLVQEGAEAIDEGLFLLFGQRLAPENDDKGEDGRDDEVVAA